MHERYQTNNMQHIDYMAYVDSFAKTKDTKSRLTHGALELCPKPLITIAIPTYKRPGLLKIALDSALNQNVPGCQYEVLVVDNEFSPQQASETAELIKQRNQNANLLYYQNVENLGIAGNWNRCIQLARGEWVAFLHDDDILIPDYVAKIRRLMQKRKDADGIMALCFMMHEGEGAKEAAMRKPVRAVTRAYDKLSVNKLMRLRQSDSAIKISNVYGAPTCGSIFRRDSLMASGGFNDSYHPSFDWLFLYRFCSKYKLYRSMERLGYYRVFANVSLLDKTKDAFMRDRINFVDYSASHSRLGSALRRLFANEQNNTILNEEYSDYAGKAAGDYFQASEIKVRKTRLLIYRLATQGYWHMKSVICLIFG